MSGGTWNYLAQHLEEWAEHTEHAVAALLLLAAIEHELDWGHAFDSCLPCARLRTVAAIEQFFTGGGYDAAPAIALARDHLQNRCTECLSKVAP